MSETENPEERVEDNNPRARTVQRGPSRFRRMFNVLEEATRPPNKKMERSE